ncbi:MAG: hypothetical protein R6U17_09770 [Thermoplasmata archaeon]
MGLLLTTPGLASAQYSDVVNDPEGDVRRWASEDEWKFTDNPDIDITRVKISETDDWVVVSLK